jgi:hypothetical protein
MTPPLFTEAEMLATAERLRKLESGEQRGSWPEHCEQRAFVQGAKWWEFTKSGGTMWASDQRDAEAEAVRRYGEPK